MIPLNRINRSFLLALTTIVFNSEQEVSNTISVCDQIILELLELSVIVGLKPEGETCDEITALKIKGMALVTVVWRRSTLTSTLWFRLCLTGKRQ